MNRPKPWIALATGTALVLATVPASAATWVGRRTTPRLAEIIAVDATGEAGWPFGKEDIQGDGDAFLQAEQSSDIRSAYAATDDTRLWVRLYVSDPNAVGVHVDGYVFIDADRNPLTGGSAAATTIDPRFTTDPSQGGYEFVFGVQSHGTVAKIWQWDTAQNTFVEVALLPAQAVAEIGEDTDPIEINGGPHGYLQGTADLALLGLTHVCDADLYVRTGNDTATGEADTEVGLLGSCVPVYDTQGVAEIVVPADSWSCTADSQCPGNGICVSGACYLARDCVADVDCLPDYQCSADHWCIAIATGSCSTNATCGGLVCESGTCTACLFGGTDCGGGQVCTLDGYCVAGSYTDPGTTTGNPGGLQVSAGEEVRGGACACTVPGAQRSGLAGLAALFTSLIVLARSARGLSAVQRQRRFR